MTGPDLSTCKTFSFSSFNGNRLPQPYMTKNIVQSYIWQSSMNCQVQLLFHIFLQKNASALLSAPNWSKRYHQVRHSLPNFLCYYFWVLTGLIQIAQNYGCTLAQKCQKLMHPTCPNRSYLPRRLTCWCSHYQKVLWPFFLTRV